LAASAPIIAWIGSNSDKSSTCPAPPRSTARSAARELDVGFAREHEVEHVGEFEERAADGLGRVGAAQHRQDRGIEPLDLARDGDARHRLLHHGREADDPGAPRDEARRGLADVVRNLAHHPGDLLVAGGGGPDELAQLGVGLRILLEHVEQPVEPVGPFGEGHPEEDRLAEQRARPRDPHAGLESEAGCEAQVGVVHARRHAQLAAGRGQYARAEGGDTGV
jgi:hypothetical protein